MQAAPGTAVISSAVLMSDTADEVDWEWSGNNYGQPTPNVQTNYFGKGITGSYDRSTSVSTNFEMTTELHKYSVDWTAESLTWSIDDEVVRTLFRKDCDNGEHQYPQTPSRFHLGVWVAGDPDKPEGVRQWAGGDTDYTKLPYTMYVKSVNLEPSSKCAYFNYTDRSGSSDSVKCLDELPKSVSSMVSSTALNTLSAAQPAPATTSRVTSSSSTNSPSSSPVTVAGDTTSTNTASDRNNRVAGGSGSVQLTTSTVYRTTVFSTVTSCNTAVTNCPANKPLASTVLVTDVVVDYTTVCPVTEDKGPSSTSKDSSTASTSTPAALAAGIQAAPPSNPVAQSSASLSALSSSGPSSTSSTSPSSTSPSSSSTSSTHPSSPPSDGSSVSSTGSSTSTVKGSSSSNTPEMATSSVNPMNRLALQQSTAPASLSASTSFQSASGEITGTQSKQDVAPSGNSIIGPTISPELTTSTVYNTNIYTVTSCGAEVTSCPAKSTVISTEVVAAYTTVCPVTSESSAPLSSSPGSFLGNPSGPLPSESAPPQSPSSLTFVRPKVGVQMQSSQTTASGKTSAQPSSDGPPPLSSSTIVSHESGSEKQSVKVASSAHPSTTAPSSDALPPSSSTTISPSEAHDVPLSESLVESHAATMSMEYGQASASLYNTDTEVKASGSSTAAATLPSNKGGDTPPVAQNHAIPGTDISQIAEETRDSHSSTGLVHPAPGSSDEGPSTTRSTITRTTTVRLTSTRRSTSTLYSTSATVMTSCASGKSGTDCSTISSTTTMIISKLVTPVTFTSTGVSTTTETVDVALSSAAGQGGSGVAGAGTGTGQQPGGAKTALATIAGAGRAFEVVPGLLLALSIGVFFL